MDGRPREVLVDTYAIISDFSGGLSRQALRVMEGVRKGDIKGVVHCGVVYELTVLWMRGRLPFKDSDELTLFIQGYFQYISPDVETIVLAGRVKKEGDEYLSKAEDPVLRDRRLSFTDALTIAIAMESGNPIVTGDADLTYVAKIFGASVIW